MHTGSDNTEQESVHPVGEKRHKSPVSIHIEGTLLMLDSVTPHIAVPVQLLCNGEVVNTTLSDGQGRYRFINLEPGLYRMRCQMLNGYVYYQSAHDASHVTSYEPQDKRSLTDKDAGDLLRVERGRTLENIDLRFPLFKKGTWRTITHFDGLANNHVLAVYQDSHGMMWFGTRGGGISRYDGREFVNSTTRDGLANN